MSTLKIGVQKKGELTNETIKYLQNLELKFEKKEKDFVAKCENIDIEIYYLRDDDIPLLVEQGALDYGIVGEDLITETKYNISVLKKLNFGKCDIAIAVPNSSNISSISELKNKVIATTFPSITKIFFGSLDINIITYFMSGSVEASPKLGIADAITDIIVTGKSIETNGLRVLKTFFSSQAVIITQAKDIDNSTYRVIDLCGNPTLIINTDYREFNYNFIKKIYRIEQTGFLDYEKQYFEMEGK